MMSGSSPNELVNIRAISFGENTTPSTRYRLLQFIDPLASQGIFIEVISSRDLKNLFYFLMFMCGKGSRTNELIWIQKKLFPTYWIWLVKFKKNIIFDFDDAIWSSERDGRSMLTKWRAARKLKNTLTHSRLVIAGNNFLADYARKLNSNVVVFPTVLDLQKYPAKNHFEHEYLMLGWIGQSVNFKYLIQLREVFKKLSSNLNFKLLVIADQDLFIEGVEVINRRWSLDTEVLNLQDIDIGLMPLNDTEWTKGKCSFKAIQYMASGIPSVVSKVGANVDLIEHGRNGFLVDNDSDWIASIELLANDVSLRQQLGNSARKTIQENYSISAVLPNLVQVLKSKKDELSVA